MEERKAAAELRKQEQDEKRKQLLADKEAKKTAYIPFYKIENDQIGQVCLYEDHQLAKKWTKMIQDCIKV